MKRKFLAFLAAFLTSASMALAQTNSAVPIDLTPIMGPFVVDGETGSTLPGPTAPNGLLSSGLWTSAEYLLFWPQAAPLPTPLATTGSLATAAAAGRLPGALGTPGTVLLSPQSQDFSPLSGGRISAGWLDCERLLGLEASGFLMESRTGSSFIGSNAAGSPSLFVPFYSPVTKVESSLSLALPGVSQGGMLSSSTINLWGTELNGMLAVYHDTWLNVYGLLGFRYLHLSETLNNGSFSTAPFVDPTAGLPGVAPPGLAIFVDHFSTSNQLYMGQLGGQAEFTFGRFFADLTGKIAVARNSEFFQVSGNTSTPTSITSGGIFTQGTNIGQYSRGQIAVVPEVILQVGFEITRNIHVFAGYDFLFITKVVRPGAEVDQQVDLTQSPYFNGAAAATASATNPVQLYNTNSFWIQGISAGLQINF